MEYTIVSVEADIEELTKAVNFMIEDGWRPVGGVAVHEYRRTFLYIQALVRTKE